MGAKRLLAGAAGVIAAAAVIAAIRRRRTSMLVFIGTQGGGIHAASLDERSGDLRSLGLAAAIERPTWLLADPKRPVIYAVSEVGNAGDREGEVASFRIGAPGGRLIEIARVSSGGGGATHLTIDDAGKTLFVANFGGGQVAAIALAADRGLSSAQTGPAHLGSGPHRRQKGPHPHGVTIDPSGRFLLAPDMGTDEIYVYHRGPAGELAPADPPVVTTPAGSGPRLVLFGKNGRFAYLLTELSAEILIYRWDAAAGRLDEIGRVAMDDEGGEERSAAGFALSGDGRHLYASNRRTNAIHVYAIDRKSGGLTEVQRINAGGAKPWALAFAPGGRWLLAAAQASDKVVTFAVDRRSGRLRRRGAPLDVASPTGFAFSNADDG